MHREIVNASDNRRFVFVLIVDGFRGGDAVVSVVSVLLIIVAVLRRGFDDLVVAEDLVAFAFAARPAGRREGAGRCFLVRPEQVLVLPRFVILTEGADLLSGHLVWSQWGTKQGVKPVRSVYKSHAHG